MHQHADGAILAGPALTLVVYEQIRLAVAVQVSDRDRRERNATNAPRVVTDGWLKSAITIAQQSADAAIAAAIALGSGGHGQIQMAVAVQVRDRDRERGIPTTCVVIDSRLESAIAVAQQHAYDAIDAVALALARVNHGQIRMAVAVQVRDRDRKRLIRIRAVANRRLKRAVAIAQQHTHFAKCIAPADATRRIKYLTLVRHGQIRTAVAVHVCDRDGSGVNPTRTVADRRLKGAVAIPQQHTYDTHAAGRVFAPASHD